VIGRSTLDLQPVFETLAENAVRLCEAKRSFIYRFDGQYLRVVATHNASPELRAFVEQNPIAPGRGSATARAALERRTVQVLDAQGDPEYTYGSRQADPFRTIITVPILKGNELFGAIGIYRHEVRAFTESQISLLETFADQAVIAIENVRLFDEVQARTEELSDQATPENKEYLGNLSIQPGRGSCVGRTLLEGKIVHIHDIHEDREYTLSKMTGYRTMLGVPLLREGIPIGVIALARITARPFTEKQIELVTTFADQAVIAIENVRLFDEIQDKSRQLAEASQHKSQFLANMSHELRTPLNAIIGVSEMLREDAEALKQDTEPLDRVLGAGRHLLALINDILDLSKIEAGRMELHVESFALAPLIDGVIKTIEHWRRRTGTRSRSIPTPRSERCMPTRVSPIMMALWDEWRDRQTGETNRSCAMIITDATEFVGELHDRMPVILEPKQFQASLTGGAGLELLKPAANDLLQ
jgi:GAF domain-containing protein